MPCLGRARFIKRSADRDRVKRNHGLRTTGHAMSCRKHEGHAIVCPLGRVFAGRLTAASHKQSPACRMESRGREERTRSRPAQVSDRRYQKLISRCGGRSPQVIVPSGLRSTTVHRAARARPERLPARRASPAVRCRRGQAGGAIYRVTPPDAALLRREPGSRAARRTPTRSRGGRTAYGTCKRSVSTRQSNARSPPPQLSSGGIARADSGESVLLI